MYICDVYQFSLKFNCQRFSNNANPIFTDEELLTVYIHLYFTMVEQS